MFKASAKALRLHPLANTRRIVRQQVINRLKDATLPTVVTPVISPGFSAGVLTLTFGLRWEDFRPPYEANGLQVDPTVSLNQYFAERNYLQNAGVPQNAMPNATLSWALNGPVNGKGTWWNPSNKNFAPRLGIAYAPVGHGGILGKIFGQNGVFRAGAGMVLVSKSPPRETRDYAFRTSKRTAPRRRMR
jgi:hypothetical protein